MWAKHVPQFLLEVNDDDEEREQIATKSEGITRIVINFLFPVRLLWIVTNFYYLITFESKAQSQNWTPVTDVE